MKTKTPGTLLVEQQIELHGPMGFDTFVSLALYHPRYGYYNRGSSPRGRKGDYFTSLQVSTLFPDIMAEVILQMKETLGTEQFSLVEWGSGDGEFLYGVLSALERQNKLKGIRVWSVETSWPARERLMRRLSRFPKCRVAASLDEIETVGGIEGCFFSNEFFDALPFRRLRLSESGWVEIVVDLVDGVLVDSERSLSKSDSNLSSLGCNEADFEPGQEIEIRPSARTWLDEWSTLLQRGYVLTFDYGYPRPELYSPHRRTGTWLCTSGHKAGANPYDQIGRQDITAHVDFTQLAEAGRPNGLEPVHFSSQGIFLSHAGGALIQERLSQASPEDQRILMGAVQQLLHPQAMGEKFWVLLHSKEVVLPDPLKVIPNRLRRVV